jgi:hypothetical protein
MDTPKVVGQKRSSLYFNKIDIYADRVEIKGLFLPRKIIMLNDITWWTEINKDLKTVGVVMQELTIKTAKTKYVIRSLNWSNYPEIRDSIVSGRTRNTERENKIYNSIW